MFRNQLRETVNILEKHRTPGSKDNKPLNVILATKSAVRMNESGIVASYRSGGQLGEQLAALEKQAILRKEAEAMTIKDMQDFAKDALRFTQLAYNQDYTDTKETVEGVDDLLKAIFDVHKDKFWMAPFELNAMKERRDRNYNGSNVLIRRDVFTTLVKTLEIIDNDETKEIYRKAESMEFKTLKEDLKSTCDLIDNKILLSKDEYELVKKDILLLRAWLHTHTEELKPLQKEIQECNIKIGEYEKKIESNKRKLSMDANELKQEKEYIKAGKKRLPATMHRSKRDNLANLEYAKQDKMALAHYRQQVSHLLRILDKLETST